MCTWGEPDICVPEQGRLGTRLEIGGRMGGEASIPINVCIVHKWSRMHIRNMHVQ